MSPSPAFLAIKAASRTLIVEYVEANPKSAAAFEAAKAAGVAGGTNRASVFYSPFPLTFVDAKEATAVTADGQQVTDLLGNFTAGLFGFSPTPVRDAINEAMDHGHALGGAANLYEARVAREFTARFPSVDLVRFTMTGTGRDYVRAAYVSRLQAVTDEKLASLLGQFDRQVFVRFLK